MRTFVFSFILFLIYSSAFAQLDSVRNSKMDKLQSATVDEFKGIREFHLGLREEVADFNQVPYNKLDSLFKSLKNKADSAIVERAKFDSASVHFAADEMTTKYILLERLLSDLKASSKSTANAYQATCAGFKIYRTDKSRLIEKVGKYTRDMQDSLEVQGKLIAQALNDLASKYPDKKSKEYLQGYAPISEMQAVHKKFEGNIVQLENLQNRIEESNGSLYYYIGPAIKPRPEITSADQILTTCHLQMKELRDWNSKYWLSQKQ